MSNKIKCINKKIEDGGATICLGNSAKDSSGILISDITWEKGAKDKDKKDKINKDSDLDFDTMVYRGPFCKTIGEFIVETNNFEEV